MKGSALIVAKLEALRLEDGQWFLGGSGPMGLRELRKVGDLDIGVTTAHWHELWLHRKYDLVTPDGNDPATRCDPPFLRTEVLGTTVDIFYAWRRRGADETRYNDFNEVFRSGLESVRGVPCLKLNILLRQKIDALQADPERWEKDLPDIERLARHMGMEHALRPVQ